MIDYVCCADCGYMIPKESLLMHEAWSCRALPLKEAPPDLAENSQNSMDSSSTSVFSDDSDGSDAIRQRRKQARFAASVAQARAVGMVEDGREVDFSIAPYAAITPRAPLVSKEGNVYNNNDTQCLEDYIACARAIGMIEDCDVDGLYPANSALPPSDSVATSHDAYADTAHSLGGAVHENEVELSMTSYDSSGIQPPISKNTHQENLHSTSVNDCSQLDVVVPHTRGRTEDGIIDELSNVASSPDTYLKVGGAILVWSLVGGAMSFMQGTSAVEGIMQGAATASIAGCVIATGNAILSQA